MKNCKRNSSSVAEHAKDSPKGHRSFLGPGSEEKWCATLAEKPHGLKDRVAEEMMILFAESGHLVLAETESSGNTSILYKVVRATAEFILRIIVTVDHSVCTEPSRIGARKLLSESKLILHKARVHDKFRRRMYLARIGRPDIPWSVNKLARAVTKWTRACDNRLAHLISQIHHTTDVQTMLTCGKHCTTMQAGTVSGL